MKKTLYLIVSAALALCACAKFENESMVLAEPLADGSYAISVSCEDVTGDGQTKSIYTNTTLTKVSNVNIYVYHSGKLVSHDYFSSSTGINVKFPSSSELYNVYMLSNVGNMTPPEDESGLQDMVYSFLDYGKFQASGFPMANTFLDYKPGSQVSFKLKRLVGMYSISMENNSDVVDYKIKSLQMRNCSRDIYPFGNKAATKFLESGDYLTSADLATLNSGGAVTVYFLENLQGELLPDNTDPKQKIPDNLPNTTAASRCTYLQMLADVTTPTAHFDNIYYRVYLGRNLTTDFSIVRSTLYNLTLDFTTNLIADEGWRIEPEDPEVIGAINLSKTEASIISGIDDIIYVTTKSANGSAVDFDVKYTGSEAQAAKLSHTIFSTTYHGKPATAIKFSTGLQVDALNSYNQAPTNHCKKVNVKIQSKDTYNGEPTITKNVVVRVFHEAFPIYFKTKYENGIYNLYAYSNNPLKLGFRIDYKTYSGQNSTVVKQDWNRFQRYAIEDNFFDENDDWSIEDNTLDRNGRKVGSLGTASNYSSGMRLDITVTPITASNFSTPYSNECFLEYPRFTKSSMYMGTGTKAYFGPGSSLSPGNTAGFPDNSSYDISVDGSPSPTSYSGFTFNWTTASGILFYVSSSTTGWNRQNSYTLSSFNGVPFYFVNGGLTLYDRNFRLEDPKYLDDSARVGIEVYGYEPGRDLGMISSNHCTFGALIATMTQFMGNNKRWLAWKSYDYNVYMTINGCSSWPGANYSSSGFSPGMYVENYDF